MHVELKDITKTFGTLRANDSLTLSFAEGRIYALLGENGAGKSTLMKILSGYQPPDSGTIFIDGRAVTFQTPADALQCGIGMLHQDPLDVPNLTVLDNFMLGRREGLLPKRKAARQALTAHATRLGFEIDPFRYVDSLTIGERQQLEIVRLLSLGARLLILDEPTTGISAEQKHMLFSALKRLAAEEGMTVILVSHKLEDVAALCQEVYVLRGGKLVGHRHMPTPIDELVTLMFGQSLPRPTRGAHNLGAEILRAESVSLTARRLTVRDLSLSVRSGEVIGLAGLDGSGQSDFLRACAGLQPLNGGRILIAGVPIHGKGYAELLRMGVAYAPSGRLEEGLVDGLTLSEHFALTTNNGLWINWRAANALAARQIARYNIRGAPHSPIQTLSGGNQQRTLIALLPENLRLLLLEDPTRGLDVESTAWVWQQLLARRDQGAAILFTSPDLDEIVTYSDRVLVFCEGRATLVEDLDDSARNPAERLGELIGGKRT
ncbi:MAG: ATP-binding cassette domain-containing protein [Chloroflexota bacterium]|jgi:simple sugar transport system ATP-binding protein|nr:MAG: ATP-binding cassette domain-containing protein [Chloroflexota bacterium]